MIKVYTETGYERSRRDRRVQCCQWCCPNPGGAHTREGMIMKEAETGANLAYAISEVIHDSAISQRVFGRARYPIHY
jgi:hypothetical protein